MRKISMFLTLLMLLFCQHCISKPAHIVELNTAGKSDIVKRIRIIQQNGGRMSWSPKGDLIAFDKKNEDGYYDAYLMTEEGEIVGNITEKKNINQKNNGNPVWHPSGKYIIFQSEVSKHYGMKLKWYADPGLGFFSNLWATTPKGDKFWRLTNIPIKKNIYDKTPIMGVLNPHFSHDGSKLIWSERYDKGGHHDWGKWQIKIADFIEGNTPRLENEKVLLRAEDIGGNYVTALAFFPNDKKILLAGNLSGQHEFGMDEYVFDLTTREITNLQNSASIWEEDASVSPSGNKIVYMTNVDSPFKLDFNNPQWSLQKRTREYWMMDADGSNKTRLTYFNEAASPEYVGKNVIVAHSSFSPDGKKLAGIIGVDYGTGEKAEIELKIVLIEFVSPQ